MWKLSIVVHRPLCRFQGSKKDEPIQELPLARIKKIMKQDGEVKMISAEVRKYLCRQKFVSQNIFVIFVANSYFRNFFAWLLD